MVFIVSTEIVLFANTDTLSISTDTLNVVAKKYSTSQLRFTANSIISKQDIQKYSTFQVSELLAHQNSSYVRDYGGIGGMKSLSIRGSSSPATIIILDGIKLNSAQNGYFDLGNLQLNNVESIELIKGGASAFYGANALSGALIINSENSLKDQIKLSYGNFSQSQLYVSNGFSIGSHNIGLSANGLYTDGKFPFSFQVGNNNIDTIRENGDYLKLNFGTHYKYDYNKWKIMNNNYLRYTNRGIPGAVVTNNLEGSSDRLVETEYLGLFGIKKDMGDNSNLNFTVSSKYNIMDYKSSFLIEKELFYENYDYSISLGYNKYFDSYIDSYFSMKIEYENAGLNGDNFDLRNNDIFRNNFAISVNLENELLNNEVHSLSSLIGIRGFKSDDYNVKYSPFISIIERIKDIDTEFKLSFSDNYRLPSFNELYYFRYGNEDLEPENGQSINLEINNSYIDNIEFSVNVFYESTKNKIQSVARSPIEFSSDNIGQTEVYGIDVTKSYTYKNLNFKLNYTYQIGKNSYRNDIHFNTDLAYMPNHIFSTYLDYKFYDFYFGIDYLYNSDRYYLPGSNPKYIIPEIRNMNCFIFYDVEILDRKSKLKMDIKNLFDNENEFIRNYPTPGRHFIITFLINY